ncbi:hypothetical protein [Nocardia asteroides]|uniref:hypothetical protein n=1 Tax=Nocardia asteroides TaxID=1824 RepID=UPI0033CC923B
MITLNDFDPRTSFMGQLTEEGGRPVIIINTLVAPPDAVDAVIEVWRRDSEVMKNIPVSFPRNYTGAPVAVGC